MTKKTKTVLAFFFVALASLAVIALIIDVIRTYNRDALYILIVSLDGSTIVKKSHKPNLSAGPFQLEGQFAPGTYRIGTDDDKTGIYNVTFSDTTLRPGRVKLSIGNSNLDLMPSRINVDGVDYQWSGQVESPMNPNR